MSDPSAAIRAGLLARLRGAGVRSYVEVPTTRLYPYAAIGPIQVIPEEDACTAGSESFVQIDVWSQKLDHSETAATAGTVRTALRTDLDLAGHEVVDQELEDTRYTSDPAGGLARAVMTLRLATEPSA